MALSPPPSSVGPDEFGGLQPQAQSDPTGAQATSAPVQPPPPGAMETVQLVASIAIASRKLADQNPELIPEIREINNQLQLIQRKLVQAFPPSQVPAPPM